MSAAPKLKLELRPPHPDEWAMFNDNWGRSAVDHSDGIARPRGLSTWGFHRAISLLTQHLLSQSQIVIACMASLQEEPIGWACWRPASSGVPLTVHYVYVKGPARRHGVGRTLLRHVFEGEDNRGSRYTFLTRDGTALLRAMGRLE